MSSSRKLLSSVSHDRVISHFSHPYHIDASPYKNVDFHPRVRAACTEDKNSRVGVKICKAVIVGDVAVGKTCIVNRYCHDVFNRDYKATIGVDFEVEKFSVLSVPLTLQIWDTAGQERFKCIAASYYRGANVVIVVFDMTDEGSLLNVPKWMEEACENADDPIKFLVGTKRDLLCDAAFREVQTRAIVVANTLRAEFWPTSSKSGENVHLFFLRLVALVFDTQMLKELEAVAAPAKQIGTGTNLIQIQRDNSQYFERKKSPQCCK
ncbi:ras-related protein Rab-34-like [Babylonia areolata]|uniref:ras-related protein Rab-34-like n=1 Tax=Babylonia areolata TaxID=304850 RepID=UPI003FD25566